MKQQNTISIDRKGLTDGEMYALEAMQIKSRLRVLGIKNIWTFFKLDFPNYDKDEFRAKINARTTDKDFVEKLKSVYERQVA